MRVISGIAKGHHLKGPPGISTRPTTDMVRGAIFSMLISLAESWDNVLDLYAGTGALGIEALSQGAQHADFVEQNNRCCSIIKENLTATGFMDKAKVNCCNVAKYLALPHEGYDIILLDPPYADPAINDILGQLTLWTGAGSNTVIMVQYSRRLTLASSYNQFIEIKNRRYGDTCVSFYHRGEKE